MRPPSVVIGCLPPGSITAVDHEVAALALGAEPERLELADDLERERVVELAHVDVVGPEPRHRPRGLDRAAPDRAVDEIGATVAAEVPRRRVLVRRPEVVGVAAEHPDRVLARGRGAMSAGRAPARSRPRPSSRSRGGGTGRRPSGCRGCPARVNGPRPK